MANEIGTLSEKSIHSMLKDILEPNKENQEVAVGKYIADIKRGNDIIEIQTQQFKNLLGKLKYYSVTGYSVKVVYPVIFNRRINWIDPDTNEIIEQRKSSMKGTIYDICKELYWIIDLLEDEHISLEIIGLDAEEYKYLDGYGPNNKKHATKIDKVPTVIKERVIIQSIADLKKLIPETLWTTEFTSSDYKKATQSRSKYLGSNLKLLREKNVICITRKIGKAFVYKIV